MTSSTTKRQQENHSLKLNRKHNLKYSLLLIIESIIFGISFAIVKFLLNANLPPFLMIAMKFLLGVGFLLAIRKLKKAPFISKEDVSKGLQLGLIIFIGYATQTIGAAYTSPAKNGLFTGLYVLFVPIITTIARRRLTIKPILFALISFLGVLIISNVFSDNGDFNIGDALTILCAVAFAFQFIYLEKYSYSLNSYNFTFIQLLTVFCLSLIASLLFETPKYLNINWNITNILYIAFLGLFATGIAFLLQTIAQTKVPANTASVIACTESAFAVIFSIILGLDALKAQLIIGAIILFLAMILSAYQHNDVLRD